MLPVPKPPDISTQIAKTMETKLEEEEDKATEATGTGTDTGEGGIT